MNPLKRSYFIGTIFVLVVGTLLHFVYDWSGKNTFVGIYGAVNESTWEHLKLLFWPSLFFSIVEYIKIGSKLNNYLTAKAISFYLGILLIITMFYTYTGVFGTHFFIVDILIFIISVIVSQYVGYKLTTLPDHSNQQTHIIALIATILLIFAFFIFTFNPPHIPLFEDPNSLTYGIQ